MKKLVLVQQSLDVDSEKWRFKRKLHSLSLSLSLSLSDLESFFHSQAEINASQVKILELLFTIYAHM